MSPKTVRVEFLLGYREIPCLLHHIEGRPHGAQAGIQMFLGLWRALRERLTFFLRNCKQWGQWNVPWSRDIFNLGRIGGRGLSSGGDCKARDTWQSGNFRSSRREVGTFSDLGCSYSHKAPPSRALNGANIIKKSKRLSVSSCGTVQECQ